MHVGRGHAEGENSLWAGNGKATGRLRKDEGFPRRGARECLKGQRCRPRYPLPCDAFGLLDISWLDVSQGYCIAAPRFLKLMLRSMHRRVSPRGLNRMGVDAGRGGLHLSSAVSWRGGVAPATPCHSSGPFGTRTCQRLPRPCRVEFLSDTSSRAFNPRGIVPPNEPPFQKTPNQVRFVAARGVPVSSSALIPGKSYHAQHFHPALS